MQILRDLLKLSPILVIGSVIAGIRTWHYISEVEPGWIEVNEVHLPIKGLSPAFAGLRLVQMSDIHMGGWMNRERLDRAVRLALSLHPDVIALTGDFLPGHGWNEERQAQLADLAAGLSPLAGAGLLVSILGNHDHWTNPRAVRAMLAKIGAVDLSNTVYTLKRGEAELFLAGVDDLNARQARLDRVLQALPSDGPAILFAHEPDFADVSAATGRFALQISGHTHGGQVALPFIGPPILPRNGRKYPSGLYRVREMYQYTNRGIGMGGKAVRLNCRPEITLFVFEEGQGGNELCHCPAGDKHPVMAGHLEGY